MSVFATIFAGLGLFFIGIKLIGSNLKQMGGRRFRLFVAHGVSNVPSSAALGVVAGALTQSSNAVTFIGVNAATAGLAKVRAIVPMIVWANVGTSALVMLATVDMHLLVLLLIGAVGLLYYLEFDKSPRLRHVVGALLGIGLLFLGLELVREGAELLRAESDVRDLIALAADSPALTLLVGLAVTVLAQSSATVTIVAVNMVEADLLNFQAALLIVYGAGVGSGLALWLMALRLRGTARQLADLQLLTKIAGALVLVPLFFLERDAGIPSIEALVGLLAADAPEQIAWVFLIYQLISAALVTAFMGPLYALVRRLRPETVEESLTKPRFIYAHGGAESETGLLLVEREQERLVAYLRDSLDRVRPDEAHRRDALPSARMLYEGARSVGSEVSAFLAELLDSSPPRDTAERLTRLQTAQGLLDDLARDVHDLVVRLESAPVPAALEGSVHGMVEGLHILIVTVLDELEDPDPFQRQSLRVMTADRGELMDRIRRTLLRGDRTLDPSEQETLFAVTAQFEHAVWLVRRYLKLRMPDEDAEEAEGGLLEEPAS